MTKASLLQAEMKKLADAAGKLPLTKSSQDIVPGEGNPEAKLMFIGEAAGYHESVAHRPFVGPAGQLLTKSLEKINLPRSQVYITNILKVRPPENRDPLPEEIAAFCPFLDAEIAIIKPQIIATLGRFSMGKFLPEAKISQVHGHPRWVEFLHQKILLLPLYHPAAALRNGFILNEFTKDFAQIPHLLNTLSKVENNSNTQPVTNPEPKQSDKLSHEQLNLI